MATTKMTRLAFMLKLYCNMHNLTQKQLSNHTGIGESTISRFLSGVTTDLALKDFNKLITFLSETAIEAFRI